MTLLTLFSAPKPFSEPHIEVIQRNAIHSWTLLPEVEVILFGNEEGVRELAREFDVMHQPDVHHNPHGTPLISSMVDLARQTSKSPFLGIINADILILTDLVDAIQSIAHSKEKFVLLSRRWDLDVDQLLVYSMGWQNRLQDMINHQGQLHRPVGSDWFIFPRLCYSELPPFAIGRSGWDNWMIYNARRNKWPVVDCTASVTIIHQNHDYGHLPGGAPHYNVPESNENIRLAGGQAAIRYTILDSTHRLVNGRLVRPGFSRQRFLRQVELVLRSMLFFLPEGRQESLVRPKRWKKRFKNIFAKR